MSTLHQHKKDFRLKIESEKQLSKFWLAISPELLKEKILLDKDLISVVLQNTSKNESDIEPLTLEEEISTEMASKLLHHLKLISLDTFKSKIAPILCEKYLNIIPKEFIPTAIAAVSCASFKDKEEAPISPQKKLLQKHHAIGETFLNIQEELLLDNNDDNDDWAATVIGDIAWESLPHQSPINLNIESVQEKRKYLQAISHQFQKDYDPCDLSLISALRSCNIISESQLARLSNNGREDEALQILLCLFKLPVDVFMLKIAPVLSERYPHLILKEFTKGVRSPLEFPIDSILQFDSPDHLLRHNYRRRIRENVSHRRILFPGRPSYDTMETGFMSLTRFWPPVRQSSSIKIKIENENELHEFCDSIRSEFLDNVQPMESGLFDALCSRDVIHQNFMEYAENNATMTRRACASYLLFLFEYLPVDVFVTDVAPEICCRYPNIIPRQFLTETDKEEESKRNTNLHKDHSELKFEKTILHDGLGHLKEGTPEDCESCGMEIGSVIKQFRNTKPYGFPSEQQKLIEYRDVLVLCADPHEQEPETSYQTARPAIGLVKGLRSSNIPLRVVKKSHIHSHIDDDMLRLKDTVIVTSYNMYPLLKRKVLFLVSDGSPEANSTCFRDKFISSATEHLVLVDVPRKHFCKGVVPDINKKRLWKMLDSRIKDDCEIPSLKIRPNADRTSFKREQSPIDNTNTSDAEETRCDVTNNLTGSEQLHHLPINTTDILHTKLREFDDIKVSFMNTSTDCLNPGSQDGLDICLNPGRQDGLDTCEEVKSMQLKMDADQTSSADPLPTGSDLSKSLMVQDGAFPYLDDFEADHLSPPRNNDSLTTEANKVPMASLPYQSNAFISSSSAKPLFSKNWQMSCEFSNIGGLLQRDDSDVILSIPENAVTNGNTVTIFGAISTDLKHVHDILELGENEKIIVPVAEFYAGENFTFHKSVLVQFPHFLSPMYSRDQVRVYRIHHSDQGDFHKEEFSLLTCTNDDSTPQNINETTEGFYITRNHCINVLTTHFCILLCTYCQTGFEPFHLELRLYGAHRQVHKRTVKICLFIWDRRLEIKDFLKDVLTDQERDLRSIMVGQLKVVKNYDDLEVGTRIVLPDEQETDWMYSEKHGRRCFSVEQRKHMEEIFCNCSKGSPVRILWSLQNKPDRTPSPWFECYVEVGYIKKSEEFPVFFEDPHMIVLHVDNLRLEDRNELTFKHIDSPVDTQAKESSTISMKNSLSNSNVFYIHKVSALAVSGSTNTESHEDQSMIQSDHARNALEDSLSFLRLDLDPSVTNHQQFNETSESTENNEDEDVTSSTKNDGEEDTVRKVSNSPLFSLEKVSLSGSVLSCTS